jgi:hypothetical protein
MMILSAFVRRRERSSIQLSLPFAAVRRESTRGLVEEKIPLSSGKVVTTNLALIFFREDPLEQAALDGLLAFENPMVVESMQEAMKAAKSPQGARPVAARRASQRS